MGEIFDVVVALAGTVATLHLFGEIDLTARERLTAIVDASIDAGATDVIFDFRDVSFCGSECLGVLIHARHRNVRVVVRPMPMLLRVLRETDLIDALDIVVEDPRHGPT